MLNFNQSFIHSTLRRWNIVITHAYTSLLVMHQYKIQCRVEALAQIDMVLAVETSAFSLDGIHFSHWDSDFLRESNFWFAEGIFEAEYINDAMACFKGKMAKLIPQIAFISQCYIEFACQPFLVKRVDKDFSFVRYVREDDAVGLVFGKNEKKALKILLDNADIPEAFYSYWNDAVNSIGYSAKLLLLCAALDALGKCGLSRDDKQYKPKFYRKIKDILGPALKKDIWGTKDDPESGLRQRLVHGDYLGQEDVEQDYVELVHEKVIEYFNKSIFGETLLEENVVDPQRNFFGNKKDYQKFIKSKNHETLNLKEVLEELDEKGINGIEKFEWVDDVGLTANY